MRYSVGKMGKWIRCSLGIIVLLIGYGFNNWWGLLGLILVATATLSWCPIYRLFGLSTGEQKERSENNHHS